MNKDTRGIAVYNRNSKFFQNLENSTKALDEHIRSLKWPLEAIRVYVDVGTGRTASKEGIDNLCQDIENKLIRIVLVPNLSRVFRNVVFFQSFLQLCEKYEVQLISLRENVDTSTAMGRCMLMFCGVLAQMEREQIAERTLDGLERARRNGKRLGRPPGKKDKRDKFGRSTRSRKGYYLRFSKDKKRGALEILKDVAMDSYAKT